ncbi:MerR family transcriptional regulator [Lentzea sp.]|uniref:MerR family transcriptional regulator n=1 Tax=Lentzea sp. TaxID=56099 RepID=UPI002ED1BA6A
MRIGELADRAGVTPRALRYYEEMGLLQSTRTASGQRVYDAEAPDRVTVIRELYAAGLGSDLIASVFAAVAAGQSNDELLTSLTDERRQLAEKMAALRDAATRLDVLIGLVENADTHECPVSLSPEMALPARRKNVPA